MRLHYIGLLADLFVVAVWASWKFGAEVDNSSYDEFVPALRTSLLTGPIDQAGHR